MFCQKNIKIAFKIYRILGHCEALVVNLGKVTKDFQYPWAKYKSLSEQHFAAHLNYAATYKNRTDFSKTVILNKIIFSQ